jgi:hypothetical protein
VVLLPADGTSTGTGITVSASAWIVLMDYAAAAAPKLRLLIYTV